MQGGSEQFFAVVLPYEIFIKDIKLVAQENIQIVTTC